MNDAVKRRVTVVLIGGNALTLLGFKEITRDVDIACRSSEPEVAKFCKEYHRKYKVKTEVFVDGLFTSIRIKDYLQKALPNDMPEFPNIDLRVLNLYDIILTKVHRSYERDLEDIAAVLSAEDIYETELDARFKYLHKYTMGPKEDFEQKYETFKKALGHLLK